MFQICSSRGFLWPQDLWNVDGVRVVPNLIGKKIYLLLTYYTVVAQAAGNWDESDLGDRLRYPCIMDALGRLAQPGGMPYRGCFGSSRGQASWRRSCDWGNGSRDIVVCEPAMYPFCQLQHPLCCGIGRIRDKQGVRHWMEVLNQDYLVRGGPPFGHCSGSPFVGPALVPLPGALVGSHPLAGSMHGMGS
jgi:hypothetical protein